MRPPLRTYDDVEKAVEMIEAGKITKRADIERVLYKCFTRPILGHRRSPHSNWDPKFQNGRGLALELVRNIYRHYGL